MKTNHVVLLGIVLAAFLAWNWGALTDTSADAAVATEAQHAAADVAQQLKVERAAARAEAGK